MKRQFVVWNTLHNEWGSGSYAAIDGQVFVRTADGTKQTHLGNTPPETLAYLLMRELRIEAHERGYGERESA